MECKVCGSSNSLTANYCQSCGQPMTASGLDIALRQAAAEAGATPPNMMEPAIAAPARAQHSESTPHTEQSAMNYGGISEVTFFSTPQNAEMNRIAYKTYAWEAAIILMGVILSIGAYAWVEKSNVMKRLGQPVIDKQLLVRQPIGKPPIVKPHVVAPMPASSNELATAVISPAPTAPVADAGPANTENPSAETPPTMLSAASTVTEGLQPEPSHTEYIEPPEMGHTATPKASKRDRTKVTKAVKATPGMLQPPGKERTRHTETLRKARVVAAVHHKVPPAETPAPAEPEPATADSEGQASGTEHHDTASIKPHHVVVAQSQPSQPVHAADPLQKFLETWAKSIAQGTASGCSQQQQALGQCH